MEEILLNYQGIIGAIAGTVLGTVSTLITTHILSNYGKVETSIFDVEVVRHEKDPLQSYDSLRLDFKVKFYNKSESNKIIDDVKVVFLNNKHEELLQVTPDDLDTHRTINRFPRVDELYFVNLSPKQLTLKKLKVGVTDSEIKDLDSIKIIELRYINKRKKKYVIHKNSN